MREVSKSIQFNAGVDSVWTLWCDVEKTPEWVDGVLLSKRMSAPEIQGVGLAWREKCTIGGQEVQVDHEVLECEPAKRVYVLAKLPFGGKTEREVLFNANGDKSEVIINMTWDLGIAASFFGDDEMEAMLERSLERTAKNWKEQVE